MRKGLSRVLPLAAVVTAISLLLASPAGTGSADPGPANSGQQTLEELASGADRIVVGTVANVRSFWHDEKIFTDAIISVEQTVLGEPEAKVVVRHLGGEVGDIGLRVPNLPSFATSERVVLFLRHRQDGTFEVVGLHQGKLLVQGNQVRVDGGTVALDALLADLSSTSTNGGKSGDQQAPPEEEAGGQRDANGGTETGTVRTTRSISLDDPQPPSGQIGPKIPVTPSPSLPRGPREETVSETTVEAPAEITAGLALDGPPAFESITPSSIKVQGFEGSWPAIDWTLAGDPTWGKTKPTCEPASGAHSGWQSGYGAGNYEPCYPNDSLSYMAWGPFSTAGATYGSVDFMQDLMTEPGFDSCGVMASSDGSNFSGPVWSGDSGGWVSQSVPLENWPGIGSLMGDSSVWILFYFDSDGSVQDRGCFLDDIDISVQGTTVKSEGFGTDWPNDWTLGGAPTWGRIGEGCNPYQGVGSGWQSASAIDPCYPNSSKSWMVYGPMNLSSASDGGVDFMQNIRTENGVDHCGVLASLDGSSFSGPVWSGNSGGWTSRSVPLSSWPGGLGDLTGEPNVWIALFFISDASNRGLGCFVDDIDIWTKDGGPSACLIDSFDPPQAPANTGNPKARVEIRGSGFGQSQGNVAFNGPNAAPIKSWSDSLIVVEVPEDASSGDVTVTPSSGSPCSSNFFVTFSYAGIKWPAPQPMGERILINANTADTAGELNAVWDGAQTWNDVAGADWYFDFGGRTSGTGYANDGVNQVFWTATDLPPEALAAVGCWYTPATGEISDCDLGFNDNYNWDTSGAPDPSEHDVQTIATHEFGHFFTCADLYGDKDSDKVMYGYGPGGQIKRTLTPYDEDCVRWIYPGAGKRGQYIVEITNNDDDSYSCVEFKSDLDAGYDRCVEDVGAGATASSFEVPATAGARTITIRWTDPDTGVPTEQQVGISVPLEGVVTASLKVKPGGVVPPDMAVSKTCVPDPVRTLRNIECTLTVSNVGSGEALDVQVVDTLPPEAKSFVDVSPGAPICSEAGGVVTCNLGTLAADDGAPGGPDEATVVITFQAPKTGTSGPQDNVTITNCAEVSASNEPPANVGLENQACDDTTVLWKCPDVNGDGVASLGDLALIALHWRHSADPPEDESDQILDLNNDGIVSLGDLAQVAFRWREECP